jgi:hypothetical protein
VIEPERALPGMAVEIKVTIKNSGLLNCIVTLQDRAHERLAVLSGDSRSLASLAPGQTTELKYFVKGGRGIYLFDHLKVTNLGKDGLLELEKSFPTPGQMFVLPHIPQLKRVNIRTRQTKVYSGNILMSPGVWTDLLVSENINPRSTPPSMATSAASIHYSAMNLNESVTDTRLILMEGRKANRSGESEL